MLSITKADLAADLEILSKIHPTVGHVVALDSPEPDVIRVMGGAEPHCRYVAERLGASEPSGPFAFELSELRSFVKAAPKGGIVTIGLDRVLACGEWRAKLSWPKGPPDLERVTAADLSVPDSEAVAPAPALKDALARVAAVLPAKYRGDDDFWPGGLRMIDFILEDDDLLIDAGWPQGMVLNDLRTSGASGVGAARVPVGWLPVLRAFVAKAGEASAVSTGDGWLRLMANQAMLRVPAFTGGTLATIKEVLHAKDGDPRMIPDWRGHFHWMMAEHPPVASFTAGTKPFGAAVKTYGGGVLEIRNVPGAALHLSDGRGGDAVRLYGDRTGDWEGRRVILHPGSAPFLAAISDGREKVFQVLAENKWLAVETPWYRAMVVAGSE